MGGARAAVSPHRELCDDSKFFIRFSECPLALFEIGFLVQLEH